MFWRKENPARSSPCARTEERPRKATRNGPAWEVSRLRAVDPSDVRIPRLVVRPLDDRTVRTARAPRARRVDPTHHAHLFVFSELGEDDPHRFGDLFRRTSGGHDEDRLSSLESFRHERIENDLFSYERLSQYDHVGPGRKSAEEQVVQPCDPRREAVGESSS